MGGGPIPKEVFREPGNSKPRWRSSAGPTNGTYKSSDLKLLSASSLLLLLLFYLECPFLFSAHSSASVSLLLCPLKRQIKLQKSSSPHPPPTIFICRKSHCRGLWEGSLPFGSVRNVKKVSRKRYEDTVTSFIPLCLMFRSSAGREIKQGAHREHLLLTLLAHAALHAGHACTRRRRCALAVAVQHLTRPPFHY